MSSCDREKMWVSESLESPIKSEVKDSFPHTAVKLENNDIFVSVGLFDDGSPFMDPGMEFKAEPEIELKEEPEIFESSEGDMKFSYDCDASVSEEGLQISQREVNKEEKSVKTDLKEEYVILLGSSRKGGKGNGRGRAKKCLRNEEQIKNRGCEKPLCQESDSKNHTDVGMNEKSFVCGSYEKQYSGVINHNTHMVIHTGGQFRCRECGKTFSKQGDLKAHYKTHTRRRSYKCSVCDKAFSKSSHLINHYRIHTGEKLFKCSVCDKAFSNRSHLTRHYKVHTREKPFKCSVCDKAFSNRSHLTRHFRIHTGEKPFNCSDCDKAFSNKSDLTIHYRIHTGEKPFKCSDCDMAFTQKSNLSKHMKICAGENL